MTAPGEHGRNLATSDAQRAQLARYRPTHLEVLAGGLLGVDPRIEPLSVHAEGLTLDAALSRAVLPALQRPPCIVSFSGGFDSTVVLAVAAHVARREGLPLPVPATLRFPDVPSSHEDPWQELAVSHLALPDWVRLELTSELDTVGPIATTAIRDYGLLSPPNWYLHQPLIELSRGGSLLTGVGGDEIFSSRGELRAFVRRPPWHRWPMTLARLGLHAAPERVQLGVWGARHDLGYQWLQPETRRRVGRAVIADAHLGPLAWDRDLRQWWTTRRLQCDRISLAVMGLDADVLVDHPLLDPRWLAEIARVFGWAGPLDRAVVVAEHFGHVVPERLVTRRDKATFGAALLSEHTRNFVSTWNGRGVDPTEVDPVALRREWTSPDPDFRTQLLLQSIWAVNDAMTPR